MPIIKNTPSFFFPSLFLLLWHIALKIPVMLLARAKVKCAINLFPFFPLRDLLLIVEGILYSLFHFF